MNTIKTTASTNAILAIDLGKYKSVVCILEEASGEYRFTTFDTSRDELRNLLTKEQPAVVLIEACLLAGWVLDLCNEVGVRCLVANTASEAWKFNHLKRKTDKDDALRLAQLYLLNQLPTVALPPSAVRQWRSLIAVRQALVGRRVAVQNRIRALFVAQGMPAPRGARAWSEIGLAGIATHAKPLGECGPDELWRGLLDLALTEYRQTSELVAQAETRLNALGKQNASVILLQTAPGLGPRTAEVVAAYLHDADRFTTGKQVSAYSGLVPRQHQSGEMDRRGRITRRGPALLRKLLVECAWCMVRYNAWARGIYLRLTGVRRELVEAQACAANLPLWPVEMPWPCGNLDYEARMNRLFDEARRHGITHCAFGDLFLEEIRAYREKQLAGSGIVPLFPLWGTPNDTTDLARNMLNGGLHAVINCVDSKQLADEFLGREFDAAMLADLPASVDPCGERGEFHTFCYGGPMFSRSIPVHINERTVRDSFHYADLLHVGPGND